MFQYLIFTANYQSWSSNLAKCDTRAKRVWRMYKVKYEHANKHNLFNCFESNQSSQIIHDHCNKNHILLLEISDHKLHVTIILQIIHILLMELQNTNYK